MNRSEETRRIADALLSLDSSISTVEDYQAQSSRTLEALHSKVDQILEFVTLHEQREEWQRKTDERIQTLERQSKNH